MLKREIILDTETTGMDPNKCDRIVQIGCVEVVNLVPTGRIFHRYLNPERDVPAEVVAVHGLTAERLKDEPLFAEIAADLLDFIGASPIVAHNAPFDLKFVNAELTLCGFKPYDSAQFVDTLVLARRKFPCAPASLDALCKRFNVDNTDRTFHGALLDARLLADVYLELCGGRQVGLTLDETAGDTAALPSEVARPQRPPRSHAPSDDEMARHTAFLAQIKDPLWLKVSAEPPLESAAQ